MIRRKENQNIVQIEKAQNGNGIFTMKKIMESHEGLDPIVKNFAHCFFNKGDGLGYHVHDDSTETIYILHGTAKYLDENKQEHILYPGDATFTDKGQGHCIICISDEPLEFVILICYK